MLVCVGYGSTVKPDWCIVDVSLTVGNDSRG